MSRGLEFSEAVREEARAIGVSPNFVAAFQDAHRRACYPMLGVEAEYLIVMGVRDALVRGETFRPWTPEADAAFRNRREAKAGAR